LSIKAEEGDKIFRTSINWSKTMANSITNRQIFFLLVMTLTTYTTIFLPKAMAETAGRSSMVPIMCSSVIFGVVSVIITKLNNTFPGKVFFDYSQEIAGRFFSYLIASYFMLYFIFVGVFLKLTFVNLMTSNFLPRIPRYEILLFGILLFAYAANKGVTNIARMFEIYGILFVLVTVVTCVFMLTEGTKFNVLPFFAPSDIEGYTEAMKELIVPFGGIEVLLIVPFTEKNKEAPKIAFLTLLFIGLFYVLIVESTIMILGINNTILLNDAFIEAIKITEAPVIERLDILYLTFGLSSLFCGMIIVFTAALEFACRIFSRVKRHIVVVAIGVILYILCLLALNIKDIEKLLEFFSFYLVIISSFLIPAAAFILAKVKKRTNIS